MSVFFGNLNAAVLGSADDLLSRLRLKSQPLT
jgi:hypothetical protein